MNTFKINEKNDLLDKTKKNLQKELFLPILIYLEGANWIKS